MTDGKSSRPVSHKIAPGFEGLKACIVGDRRLKVTRTEFGHSEIEEPVNALLSDERCHSFVWPVSEEFLSFPSEAALHSCDCFSVSP